MIDLTPLEVRKKKGDFRKAMRGYDPALVDDFLDLAADRMEQLVRENMTLSDRSSRLEAQVADFREREKALTEALVTAQEMREEVRRAAVQNAELLRREAEGEAASIRRAAQDAKHSEEEGLRRLRAQRAQLMKSFRAFLERELSELSVAEEAMGLRRRGSRGQGASGVAPDLFVGNAEDPDDLDVDPDALLDDGFDDTAESPRSVPASAPLKSAVPAPPAAARRRKAPDSELMAGPANLPDDDAVDVSELAPRDSPENGRNSTSSSSAPVADTPRRGRTSSLADLEEEVLRDLREEGGSAEKAALLSSVLEEDV
jgi:cell division initiation protein